MGTSARKSPICSGSTTVRPSGRWRSMASRAKNLLGANPTETPQPSCRLTSLLIILATRIPKGMSSLLSVTSRMA